MGALHSTFLSTLSLRRATQRGSSLVRRRTYFYPRSPCGERQLRVRQPTLATEYFYPRSPCGERLQGRFQGARVKAISIHALLAESDAACAGVVYAEQQFLSTLSLRRATPGQPRCTPPAHNFYPRSPCGERRLYVNMPCAFDIISIHALLAESDQVANTLDRLYKNFYPRSPCGERRMGR